MSINFKLIARVVLNISKNSKNKAFLGGANFTPLVGIGFR